MESMFGKFPLANRPKMTRRKRKNMNLTPGASSTTSMGRAQRGGSSPTTEPTNNSADTASSGSSSTTQSPTTSRSGPGPHRRTKSAQQGRKRGGNPYNWLPSNSPVHERRNAISAGPHNTNFSLFASTDPGTLAPASAPLMPTYTWPMSTAEGEHRFSEPTLGELVHTRSDGALGPRSQALNQQTSVEYSHPVFVAPQTTVPCDLDQQSYPTNYAMSNHSSHSFDPILAGQTFPWQGLQPNYPSSSIAEHYPVIPNDDLSLGSPSAFTGLPDMTFNGPYSSANGTDQTHFLNFSNTYAPLPTADSGAESHLQSVSPTTRRASAQSSESCSLANLTFSRGHPTQ